MHFVYLKYELLKMTVKFTVEQIPKKMFALYDNYIRIRNTLILRAKYPAIRILLLKLFPFRRQRHSYTIHHKGTFLKQKSKYIITAYVANVVRFSKK